MIVATDLAAPYPAFEIGRDFTCSGDGAAMACQALPQSANAAPTLAAVQAAAVSLARAFGFTDVIAVDGVIGAPTVALVRKLWPVLTGTWHFRSQAMEDAVGSKLKAAPGAILIAENAQAIVDHFGAGEAFVRSSVSDAAARRRRSLASPASSGWKAGLFWGLMTAATVGIVATVVWSSRR